MEVFIVIDGNSLINRAFYALPPLNGKDNKPTQAVYGFVTMLIKLMEYRPEYMAVAFDLKAPTFRHKKYELYKANRKGMPDDLAVQMPILKDLLRVMNIAVVEKEGYEADDIIGTMAKHYDGQTYIVTGDRDSFQLIDDKIKVLMTKRGITEVGEFDREALAAEYNLTPSGVIEYKSLAGDQSDNIPGVPGVGDKTATELVKKYGTLDNIYANIQEITGKLHEKLVLGKEIAYLSHELATINVQVPDLPLAQNCRLTFPFADKVRDRFEELNFKSLVKREELFAGGGETQELPESIEVTAEQLESLLKGAKSAPIIWDRSGLYTAVCGVGYVLPIKQTLLDEGADDVQAANAVKTFAEGDGLKIVFDAKTLKKKLYAYGVSLDNYFDVELCQYLLNSAVDHESLVKLGAEYGFVGGVPLVLMKLYEKLIGELEESGMSDLYYKLELPLISVLFDMERTGFKVDEGMLDELSLRYGNEIAELQAEIFKMAGREFNINSPKQLAAVLFEELKIPYPKKSKTFSTGAEVLEPLRGNFQIVDSVLQYRFLAKLKSTYLDGLRPMIDRNGLVHTEFRQMLTSTGRLSSVEPNLQNIPVRTDEGKGLRKLFVARDDNVLISADYSQIELRLMAHLSGDERMVSAYINGEDIHSSTAAEIYGVEQSEVTPAMRREAKIVNFGIIYGMSDFGLAQNLNITPKQAAMYIKRYFERFGGVRRYLAQSVESAREKGYVETIFGRRRYVPELRSSNYNSRMFGERVAMNTPLQGSAADLIKKAMIEVAKRLSSMKSKLILQIHDELIVDTAQDEIEAVKNILIDCMENVAELRVPLKVEVGCGKRWYDCK